MGRMATLLAPALVLVVIAAALVWPGGHAAAAWAVAAVAVAALTGLVGLPELRAAVALTWDATLALLALMLISRVLADAGGFALVAWWLGSRAGSRPRRLLLVAVALSALTSAVFTNDGTVLLLTPVLAELVVSLGLGPEVAIPLLLTNGFVADAFSTPLVNSNLVNILAVDRLHISFASYAASMALPSLAALTASLATLWLGYGRRLPRVQTCPPRPPRPAVDGWLLGAGSLAVLGAGAALVLTATHPFPVSLALVPAAAALWVAVLCRRGWGQAMGSLGRTPWQVIVFVAGMNLLVLGLDRTPLGALISAGLAGLHPATRWGVVRVGLVSAVAAASINNLPATLLGLVTLPAAAGHAAFLAVLALRS